MWKVVAWLSILSSETAYVVLLLSGDLRARPRTLLACLAVLALAYAAVVLAISRIGPRVLGSVLVASALYRATLLPATPTLSDDVYRYLWDGRVLIHGVNPYRYAPSDPALVALRDPAWSRIGYPELPTIYPPLSELWFAIANVVPASARILALKVLAGICEVALCGSLAGILVQSGRRGRYVLVYLLHPVPILELYHSAHAEALAVAALVLAASALGRSQRARAGALLAASILCKPFALALVPSALPALRRRGAVAILLVIFVAYAPFLGAGANLYRGLWEYGTRWRFYDSGHALVLAAVTSLHLGDSGKALLVRLDGLTYGTPARGLVRSLYPFAYDGFLARAIVVGLFATIAMACAARRLPFTKAALVLATAFCLLTPTLHPWYVIWLLPWLAVHFSWGLAALSLSVSFSYATFLWPAAAGAWEEPVLLKAITLGTSLGLLALELSLRTLRARATGSRGSPAPPCAARG